MSFAFEIIKEDRATTEMQKIGAKLAAKELDGVIGESIVDSLRERFAALDLERPNQLGGDRTHYYEGCADMTTWSIIPDGVLISVTKEGIRTRILGTCILPGGAIFPINAKHLAVPAIAEAYGKGPSEFEDLVPLYRKRNGQTEVFALAEDVDEKPERAARHRNRDETVIDHGNSENRIFFWLVDSVVQQGDPSIIPSESEIKEKAFFRLDQYFADEYRGEIRDV